MSEKTTSSSSSKVAVAEESLPEEEEAKKTNQGRADKPSTVDEAVQQVSSLFNQRIMNEPFCTQWFEHFRVPKHDDKQLYTDADVTRTIVETVSRKPNATRSSDEKNTSVDDVRTLYTKAIEAHLNGQFRESFQLLRPLLPFLATDPCIWIRLTEACVYELFDATSSYDHIYPRLFQKATRRRPPRRSENQKNDPTVRHPEQNLEFAECTSLVAFTMAQNSNNTQYLIHSSRLAAFVAMKMEKYRNALEIVSWLFRRNSQMELSSEQLATMILYRIESFYHTGEYTKAYTGANQVLKQIRNPRLTTRASMVSVLACLKRYEYTKAFNELKAMLHDEYLDTEMQESAALLGMYLSYTVRSDNTNGTAKRIKGLQMLHLRSLLHVEARKLTTKYASSADVVICGGGISGTSLAYHLAKRGKKVCLFEKDAVGCGGATSVSAGLMTAPTFWQDASLQSIAATSLNLYTKLAESNRFRFIKCGRVYLSSSTSNEIILRRMYSRGIVSNEHVELIDCQSEMLSRWPFLQTEDVQLALFSPDDVALDMVALSQELARQAKEHGAQIFENCEVTEVMLGDEKQVYAVETVGGLVETPVFVDASGVWTGSVLAKNLAHRHVQTATYPCTYSYIHTAKLPTGTVSDMTPIFNDLDSSLMIRATSFKTLSAGFAEDGIRPLARQSSNNALWNNPEPDWDKFATNLDHILHRCPMLGEIDHGDLICGMESYTPDKVPTIGESSQAKGYYVMCGMNGQGLSFAGGLGKILSEIICDGVSTADVSRVDVGRFVELHANNQYLMERVPEVAANIYQNFYHSYQCHTARNLRMAPIYHQLRDAGAVFGEIMGYERPLWFEKNPKPDRNALMQGQDVLLGKPHWFDRVAAEYEACRERVGLIDMSSFAKYDITGPDSLKFLQYLCSANVDQPVGTTVYTGMQHERGGYVTDCTLSRLSKDSFFMVAPTIQQERCMTWMKKWIEKMNVKVHIQDVTGAYTALDIIGPSSRYLMGDVTGLSMSSSDFPTFRCQEINIGMATGIRAISVTHCGELGWVIYIPNEMAQNVYEKVVKAGKEYSLLHAGYYTLRQLRIEKFYVYWGQDINATVTPVECGRAFRVDFKKDFIGKEALEKQLERGVSKRFVQLLVDNHESDSDPWPQGGETLYRDGRPIGMTTSAAYGFTLGSQVCIAYLENKEFGISPEFINRGTYELDIAGKRFPVRVNLHSPSLPMISSEHPLHYRPTQ